MTIAELEQMLPPRDVLVRYALQKFCEDVGIDFFKYDCTPYSQIVWDEAVALPPEEDLYNAGRSALLEELAGIYGVDLTASASGGTGTDAGAGAGAGAGAI